jgi:hypothetical protein
MIGQTFTNTARKTFLKILISKNASSPREMSVHINCFVDANHAENKLN